MAASFVKGLTDRYTESRRDARRLYAVPTMPPYAVSTLPRPPVVRPATVTARLAIAMCPEAEPQRSHGTTPGRIA